MIGSARRRATYTDELVGRGEAAELLAAQLGEGDAILARARSAGLEAWRDVPGPGGPPDGGGLIAGMAAMLI